MSNTSHEKSRIQAYISYDLFAYVKELLEQHKYKQYYGNIRYLIRKDKDQNT